MSQPVDTLLILIGPGHIRLPNNYNNASKALVDRIRDYLDPFGFVSPTEAVCNVVSDRIAEEEWHDNHSEF